MVHLEENSEWFATWFDSEYYHLLYNNRDENEASDFLALLTKQLTIPTDGHVLDLACGAGRHSRVLARLGYLVSGCDLSKNSIDQANNNALPGTDFFVHDMRNQLSANYSAIFNLFTSFGYFDDLSDNLSVLKSVESALDNDGVFVLDFMNATKVIAQLIPSEIIQRGEIHFNISREVVNQRIVKSIAFEAEGKSYHYEEKVQALQLADFELLFEKAGLKITARYGSYALAPFSADDSDRLILIARKA
jgi:SAM-dependent methyltransferase